MAGKKTPQKIKMGFVTEETMLKDLNKAKGRRGRVNPLLDEVEARVLRIKDKPLSLEVTPAQRTGILNRLKKEGLLATRKDPNRKYSAKYKILERNGSNKPSKIRMYIMLNEAHKG